MFLEEQKELNREFQKQFIPYLDYLYTIALRMTYHKEDAEDLVQETAFRAYRFFGQFKPGTNFKAWLVTILRNIYINNYRKRKKEPKKVEFDKVKNFIPAKEIEANEDMLSERIKSAIEELPDDLGAILALFYIDRFSYKEIAEIIAIPLGTVMSRLYTARQILKKELLSVDKNER